MSKMQSVLYSMFFIACLLACSDDENVPGDVTFKKEDFIGTWQRTSTTVAPINCEDESEIIEFRANDIASFSIECSELTVTMNRNYHFDNDNTITVDMLGVRQLIIRILTPAAMVVDILDDGVKKGSSSYTKV